MDMFKDLKVGDKLVVVQTPPPVRLKTYTDRKWDAEVTKIGRKYFEAVLAGYKYPIKFTLEKGMSVDSDCNARVNGYGYDAYRSEEHYETVKFLKVRREQLVRYCDNIRMTITQFSVGEVDELCKQFERRITDV